MRVFVTGASGFIGSATTAELLAAGHQVVGLARSDAAAATVEALGAEVVRGGLDDLELLRSTATASDGVIHLGYNHDFSDMAGAAATDRAVIEAFGDALEGTDRGFVVASGMLGLASGRLATERDMPDLSGPTHPRAGNAGAALELSKRGVRSSIVRFSPTVHGEGDHGFVARLIEIAREKGASGYVGEGANRWPAVHRLDAAVLCRLAVEKAAPGSVLHGIADEGVPAREIAEVIGRHLDLPVVSIGEDEIDSHFGWLGRFFGADIPGSNAITRAELGWSPDHPGLIEDLEAGHYFA